MSKKSWYTKKNPLNRAKNKTTYRSVAPTKFWQNTSGKFLNLSRDISFFDPTMKIVFTLSILVVLASLLWKTLFTNVSSEASTIFALNNGAIFFFSWLLAREVDPDRPLGGTCSRHSPNLGNWRYCRDFLVNDAYAPIKPFSRFRCRFV